MTKSIFITGTNSGFGRATVERFAKEGWKVAATVRNAKKHKKLFADLPNVQLHSLDVTDYEQVEAVAQQVIGDLGKVDVVVNNAGYCIMGPTETTSMQQIEEQFRTNTFGVFAVCKAFIGHMRENKEGLIINIASSSALFNNPFIGAYGSSKWAVRGLTEALNAELEPFGVELKVIYPGLHATGIFSKLESGTQKNDSRYSHYMEYFKNFVSGMNSVPNATPPSNIANEVYRAATKKGGPINIVSGGDVKMQNRMRRFVSDRSWVKQQAAPLHNGKPGAMQMAFIKWLFGSKATKLVVDMPKELVEK